MRSRFRVVQYGLGAIGLGIARILLERPEVELVGAVDVAPERVGRDLGELLGTDALGVRVSADSAIAEQADVVLHATHSRLAQVVPQILEVVQAGANVISTCEELVYPWFHHAQEAERLDEAARARGVTVTGVGVNPGFAMDLLPVVLTAACAVVKSIRVERRVDVSRRRESLQRKAGVGLSEEEFWSALAEGRVGHVGLAQSVALIGAALGWPLEIIADHVEPVRLPGLPGVAGIHQVARGLVGEEERIRLELTLALGLTPGDRIVIQGEPPLTVEIPGGLHGDMATCALTVNTIPIVAQAPPGLRTVLELPPIRCTGSISRFPPGGP
ncbi:MAG: dihydrodipicolinate reductase [Armatimonadota bacterium]|nr:dihydrodipicolinate reductase [Armatimonadota bacterium]MDR7562759.1 dihydrodipicolinate reductase [Armatimonadota bacterium]MDR7568735.1 dihydrodipicolinate reductase [Armatimonadota bacterium]MDR7601085.1 dihydrodipicolinate reductase [Armatimonadota bacterium]